MEDILQTVQIDSKGYGMIYKLVMRNKELPIIAKSIYAYLCAYAGSGTIAFPKREKIINDLQINKDTYTKYMRALIERQFIRRQKTATGNVYTINMEVPSESKGESLEPQETPVLCVCTVKARGYGTIPKLVMLDKRLTAQAKAIYAYFCSFTGAGNVAFPHKQTIIKELGISSHTYYTHFALLTSLGYISVTQRKNQGKFSVSEYWLNDCVEQGLQWGLSDCEKPVENHRETVEKEDKIPLSEKQQSGEKMSEKMQSDKIAHRDFGRANIKNKNIINSNYIQEQYDNQQPCGSDEKKAPTTMTLMEIKNIINFSSILSELSAQTQLKARLGHFADEHDMQRFEEVGERVVKELVKQSHKILNCSSKQIRIGQKLYNVPRLQSALKNELCFDTVLPLCLEVVEKYREIRNIPQYIKGVLFNRVIQVSNQ